MRILILTSLFLVPLLAEQTRGDDPASRAVKNTQLNLGFERAPDDVIEPLLVQLGSPDFSSRETASKRLTEIGPAAFPMLSRHYRENDDFEVRLRIQTIVKNQYLWHTLLKRKGFMGIAYTEHTGAPLGEGVSAIVVSTVQPGSAADEAGLAPNDLIVSVNDRPTNDLRERPEFAELIQNQGAGGKIVLGIMRRGRTKDVTLRLKARPIEQYVSPELLDELNSRMQAYSVWWEKHFSLPRVSHERLPSSEVLQIPD